MKLTMSAPRFLTVIGVVLAALAQPVTARAEVTMITNAGNARTKVCVYRSTDHAMMVALQCWTLSAGETARWTHERDTSTFNVVVYEPGLIDGFLCSAKNQSANLFFSTSPCKIGTSDPKGPGSVDVRIRVCNRTQSQTVNFVLGYPAGHAEAPDNVWRPFHAAEGWWSVEKGECVEVSLNDRWPADYLAYVAAAKAEVHIYGETGGIIQKVWAGTVNDQSFCIDGEHRFAVSQWLAPKRACPSSATQRVRMHRVDPPTRVDERSLAFYWNF